MSKLAYTRLQEGDVINGIRIDSYAFSRKAARWMNCTCHCGVRFVAQSTRLKSGHTRSCGCLRKQCLIERNKARAGSLRENQRKRTDAMAAELPVGILELTRTEGKRTYKVLGVCVSLGNGVTRRATRSFGRKRTREQAIAELQVVRQQFLQQREEHTPSALEQTCQP